MDATPASVRILGVNGSLRAGSLNAAVLTTASGLSPEGVEFTIVDVVGRLPLFSPDLDVEPLPGSVTATAAAINDADAVLFCVPEYAGGLPGAFKNFLDWTVSGSGGSLYGKPVGWLNAGAEFGRGRLAHESLRTILGFVGADIVEDACRGLAVTSADIGRDLEIVGELNRAEIVASMAALRQRTAGY